MDKAMVERHLAAAERHIVRGEQRIARQHEIIAALEHEGHDLVVAKKVLDQLVKTQATFVAHRDQVKQELAGNVSSPAAVS